MSLDHQSELPCQLTLFLSLILRSPTVENIFNGGTDGLGQRVIADVMT